MKKFIPIIIASNPKSEQEHQKNLKAQIEAIKEMKAYLSNYVILGDYNELKDQSTDVILNAIKQKYGAQFPPILSAPKISEMIEFNFSKFDTLLSKISKDISTDWNDYTSEFRDFNTYSVNDQQNEAFITICKAIAQIKKIPAHVYPMQLMSACSGTIAFNHETNELFPNTAFIQSLRKERIA
jgi:hypothetical protein